MDSEIPKGSVLGPILFVIYINDLPEIVESQIYLFADDTKLYRTISDINDQEILQKDLNIMNKWSDIWLLRIYADKCKHVNIRSNKNEEHDANRYKLNNSVLQTVDEEKDWGYHRQSIKIRQAHIWENNKSRQHGNTDTSNLRTFK